MSLIGCHLAVSTIFLLMFERVNTWFRWKPNILLITCSLMFVLVRKNRRRRWWVCQERRIKHPWLSTELTISLKAHQQAIDMAHMHPATRNQSPTFHGSTLTIEMVNCDTPVGP